MAALRYSASGDFEGPELLMLISAANDYAKAHRNTMPECGHSMCRQHWIDTGKSECVRDQECPRCHRMFEPHTEVPGETCGMCD